MPVPKKTSKPKNKTSKKGVSSATSKKNSKASKKATGTKAPKTVKKVAKKPAAPKTVKKSSSNSTGSETKSVRSFKVQLPGTDVFVGRFTGLTPYQAANKALSKYYRETKKPKQDIQFSIRESTRGSKRGTYTYNGARLKLDEPVKYTISNSDGEDREIIKKFKNKLTKVKKSELAASK
tara:strand:- start:14 stop:550 length:537 start_codon:yes stop_codon:yes gene_type:complete